MVLLEGYNEDVGYMDETLRVCFPQHLETQPVRIVTMEAKYSIKCLKKKHKNTGKNEHTA